MRDILNKNLTSMDNQRRDIFLSEQFVQQGVTTKTEKHFIYSVRDHAYLNSPDKLQAWIKRYANKAPRLRNLTVVKNLDSKIGEEKFEVKIVGNLYVLRDQDIFSVDFTQVFKIDRKGDKLKGHKK